MKVRNMKAYRIEGEMRTGKKLPRWQFFRWQIAAKNEDQARESVLSEIGSKHGVTRKKIRIDSVTKIEKDEITNPKVEAKIKKK